MFEWRIKNLNLGNFNQSINSPVFFAGPVGLFMSYEIMKENGLGVFLWTNSSDSLSVAADIHLFDSKHAPIVNYCFMNMTVSGQKGMGHNRIGTFEQLQKAGITSEIIISVTGFVRPPKWVRKLSFLILYPTHFFLMLC